MVQTQNLEDIHMHLTLKKYKFKDIAIVRDQDLTSEFFIYSL
jgi:hypothetical protein